MREWIDIVEGVTAEPELLEEKGFGFGHLATAAALAGTVGYHAKGSPERDADLPQMIYTDMDGSAADIAAQDWTDGASDRDIGGGSAPEPTPAPTRQHPVTAKNAPKEAPKARSVARDSRGQLDELSKKEAIQLLALTMWGEARSDGKEAMRAVGHVVMNRINSERKFGRNIKEVVWKRKAFSCWNAGDPNREAMKKIAHLPDGHPSKVRWEQALELAKTITAGGDRDPTAGSLFYHTKAMGKPYWVSNDMKPDAQIASHLFYKTDAKS